MVTTPEHCNQEKMEHRNQGKIEYRNQDYPHPTSRSIALRWNALLMVTTPEHCNQEKMERCNQEKMEHRNQEPCETSLNPVLSFFLENLPMV
jgi:hypothetical protein